MQIRATPVVASVLSRFTVGVVLLVALVVRLVVLVVHLELLTLPQGGADEASFERHAWQLSEYGRGDLSSYLFSGGRFIALMGSYIYDVTGRAPYALGLLMVLLGTALVYIGYQTALELWGDVRVARIVAWAFAIFPQLVQHSVLFLREIPVAFCIAAAGLCAVRFFKRESIAHIGWFVLWVFLGTLFHSGVIFAIPALLMGMFLVRPQGRGFRLSSYVVKVAAALVLIASIVWVNETGYGLDKFGGSLDEALETFEAQEGRVPLGGAAFPEWMSVRGGLSEGWKIPIRYVAFLFSPLLPFLVRNPYHLLGVVDAALYVLMFWALLRNWRMVGNSRPAFVLFVVAMTLFLVYSLGVANFGTAIRHRAKIVPLLLVLTAALPALRRTRRLDDSPLPAYR